MPESYQVAKAEFKKVKSGERGDFHIYGYLLDPLDGGQAKDAEEFVYHTVPILKEGEHVEGTITQGQFGLKFKRADRAGTPAASAPKPSDGRDSFRKHPAEVAAVRRAHAQDMALREAQVRALLDREGFARVFSDTWLKQRTDWYAEDAAEAEKAS